MRDQRDPDTLKRYDLLLLVIRANGSPKLFILGKTRPRHERRLLIVWLNLRTSVFLSISGRNLQ
jgi:hypothetical protein